MKTKWTLYFWILNIFTAFLRLLFISSAGLTTDEAHYWVYSKFLSLSYFDHPPMIGYIIKVSTLIFGDSVFAVRFPAVLIFFTASFIFYLCAEKLFDGKIAFAAVLLLNIMPVFSFFGAVINVPDTPLALFWLLSFFLFILILKTEKKIYWHFLGFSLGFAMLSKYNAAALAASILMFLLLSKRHRFILKTKEPYIALLESVLIFLPVIIWNYQNGFASFAFQFKHGFGSGGLPPLSLLSFFRCLGAQSAYISPPFFVLLAASVYFCVKEFIKSGDMEIKERNLLILSFCLPILILFNAVSLFNEILPHWPAMGYLSLTMYAAYIMEKNLNKKWFRNYIVLSYIFTALVIVVAVLHIKYKIIPIEKFLPQEQALKIEHGIKKSEQIDITNDLFGWQEIGKRINEVYASFPEGKKPFIFTYKSYLAGQLYFGIFTSGNIGKQDASGSISRQEAMRIFCLSDRIDGYDFWQKDLDILKGKTGIFISSDYFYTEPSEYYGEAFTSYSKAEEFSVYRDGVKIKNFFIVICRGFDPDKMREEIKMR